MSVLHYVFLPVKTLHPLGYVGNDISMDSDRCYVQDYVQDERYAAGAGSAGAASFSFARCLTLGCAGGLCTACHQMSPATRTETGLAHFITASLHDTN